VRHAGREGTAALPGAVGWEAHPRRALWEDIQSEHRALTADVLQETKNGPVAERVGTWMSHNATAVDRCTQVLADVKAGDASDLATLSVAVREIRNLIDATTAPAPEATEPVERPVAPVSG
jgi:glutamate dehydrogenase